jgi:hypothetical protein
MEGCSMKEKVDTFFWVIKNFEDTKKVAFLVEDLISLAGP